MSITTEKTFETAIVTHLTTAGGWNEGRAADYDVATALVLPSLLGFIQDTQPDTWEKLAKIHGAQLQQRFLQTLCRELELRGALDVLRNGFTDHGCKFKLAYFKPETALNPHTQQQYESNRLEVIRQLYFSASNNKSLDIVLCVNGLPLATMEVKNLFTGQQAGDAEWQYQTSRDPQEPLFRFRQRTLVHFAVDPVQVFMTTKLEKEKTLFLPFNKGYRNGAGNPPHPTGGYAAAYLWEEILEKDSWMDILGRYMHLVTQEITDSSSGKKYKKESLIFPRYHQLDVVRHLTADARTHGAGKNYLVQHSAGSGKSNSIAWLAYRLAGLHNTANEKIFNCVIVVTDRKVLDQQLQKTIYQFEHKTGVVQKIDKDSAQLAEALEGGINIIITTLQKFPFIVNKLDKLPERRYAIIIDEAHSSQGGEATKKMKEVLSVQTLEEALAEESEAEESDSEDFVRQSMEARGKLGNASFFAFTATPKFKTIEVFGHTDYSPLEYDKNGKPLPKPFHLYSMRQAIEEGFILDVLQHYVTYDTYFRLSKNIEDDPQLNKRKAAKAIGRFVSLHPHNIAQKTEVMIEHFRQVTARQIGGLAKAMVVTSSRLHALRYYIAFNAYLREKGYTHIRALVAFSGKVKDDAYPDGIGEAQLNGFGEKELPARFATEAYRLLLVADKYQTGFDEPLLHTMYVDKKLSGVKAVQTLSRLNRTRAGKDSTFVLDFVNDRETILQSFQPYYELTTIAENTDPNLLYTVKYQLDAAQVYQPEAIDAVAALFFKPDYQPKDQAQLYHLVRPAIERYNEMDNEEAQDSFKKLLAQWLRLYAFLAQVMPFQDADLEKFFAYARLLQQHLPKRDVMERLQLTDEVALAYYRLQQMSSGPIVLEKLGQQQLRGATETGMKRDKDAHAHLSEIIHLMNDRFGRDTTDADKLFFDQLEAEMLQDEVLVAQAKANTKENFELGFQDRFIQFVIDRMEQNEEIFSYIMNDGEFSTLVKQAMLNRVYGRVNGSGE